MKILYFDCFSGISGDMTLGSLIDLGVDPNQIIADLKQLNMDSEFHLEWRKVVKNGISATKVDVVIDTRPSKHHHHRHYSDIVKMIENTELNQKVKEMSLSIFNKIGLAESKIHNISLEKVHFHEVGAVDSIVDIVGSVIAIDLLDVDAIYSSSIPLGQGKIKIDHGVYPVPAPATLEMLKGIPIQHSEVVGELTTPTGAGIVSALVTSFEAFPSMQIESIGYGAGTKDFELHPNVLRAVVGER